MSEAAGVVCRAAGLRCGRCWCESVRRRRLAGVRCGLA